MKKRACVLICLIFAFASFFGVRALTTRTVSAESLDPNQQITLSIMGIEVRYWDSHDLQERSLGNVSARFATIGYLGLTHGSEVSEDRTNDLSVAIWLVGAGPDGTDLEVEVWDYSTGHHDFAYYWHYGAFGKYRIKIMVEYDAGHYHDEDFGCIAYHKDCTLGCEEDECWDLVCTREEDGGDRWYEFNYDVICKSSDSPNFGASFVRGKSTFTELWRLEAGRKYEVRARQRDENYYWVGDTATYEKDPNCDFMALGDGGKYLILNVPKNMREYTLNFTVNYDFIDVSDTGEVLPPVRISETIQFNLSFSPYSRKTTIWEIFLWIAILGGLAGIMYIVTIMAKRVEGS